MGDEQEFLLDYAQLFPPQVKKNKRDSLLDWDSYADDSDGFESDPFAHLYSQKKTKKKKKKDKIPDAKPLFSDDEVNITPSPSPKRNKAKKKSTKKKKKKRDDSDSSDCELLQSKKKK